MEGQLHTKTTGCVRMPQPNDVNYFRVINDASLHKGSQHKQSLVQMRILWGWTGTYIYICVEKHHCFSSSQTISCYVTISNTDRLSTHGVPKLSLISQPKNSLEILYNLTWQLPVNSLLWKLSKMLLQIPMKWYEKLQGINILNAFSFKWTWNIAD